MGCKRGKVRKPAYKGNIFKPVTTLGRWSLILLGSSGKQYRIGCRVSPTKDWGSIGIYLLTLHHYWLMTTCGETNSLVFLLGLHRLSVLPHPSNSSPPNPTINEGKCYKDTVGTPTASAIPSWTVSFIKAKTICLSFSFHCIAII